MLKIAVSVLMCYVTLFCHAPYQSSNLTRVREGNKTITYYQTTMIKTPEYRIGIANHIPNAIYYAFD